MAHGGGAHPTSGLAYSSPWKRWDKALTAWSKNLDCRTAGQPGGMLTQAVELYHAATHLHPGDHDVWRNFLDRVRTHEPVGSYYRYDQLEAALNA